MTRKMTRKNLFLFTSLLLSSIAVMHAQGGCVDSPEAPTDVLAMVGVAGLYFCSRLRSRFAANKSAEQA
jgi:XrtJ-associated TM-motif-TM protein